MGSAATFIERQMLRLEARWWHLSLDERLAAGFDPASEPALAMRAEQLSSPRHRRRLAAWIERLARDSKVAGRPARSAAVPVVREQVEEAGESLLRLATELRRTEPVPARGVAIVQRLLSDSDSVVYTSTARGAVELQIQAALGALQVWRDQAPHQRQREQDPFPLETTDVGDDRRGSGGATDGDGPERPPEALDPR